MKELIIVLLLSFCFCNINKLEKLGSITVTEEEGLIYLDTKDYSIDDKIILGFSCSAGSMNQKIYYEFNDNIPNDSDYCPYIYMTPSTNSGSSGSFRDTTLTYYYHIRKNENYRYLLVRYINLWGKYMEIEHYKMTIIAFVFLIIGICLGALILIGVIVGIVIYIKKRS